MQIDLRILVSWPVLSASSLLWLSRSPGMYWHQASKEFLLKTTYGRPRGKDRRIGKRSQGVKSHSGLYHLKGQLGLDYWSCVNLCS